MTPIHQQLLNLADEVLVYEQQRGYNYAIHVWDQMYKNWCKANSISEHRIPSYIMEQIKARGILFQEYFSNETKTVL